MKAYKILIIFLFITIISKTVYAEDKNNSIWEFHSKVSYFNQEGFNKTRIFVPYLYQMLEQRVDMKIKSDVEPLYIVDDTIDGIKGETLYFDSNKPEINLEVIRTVSKDHEYLNRNITLIHDNYTSYTPEELKAASALLTEIKAYPKFNDVPFYAKIAKFIYKEFKYDTGVEYGVVDQPNDVALTIKLRRGVCRHFSKLYKVLARISGIPTVEVTGFICENDNGKCGLHSWDLIYYKSRWIYIDPTFNDASGDTSKEHVAAYIEDSQPSPYYPQNLIPQKVVFGNKGFVSVKYYSDYFFIPDYAKKIN